jgi:hypothetical protein
MHQVAQDLLDLIDQVFPMLEAISAEEAAIKPAPNKWSKKEIIGHLVDSANNKQQKFIRIQASDGHLDFVGYAQDTWVAIQDYQHTDWKTLLQFWYAFNTHLAHVISKADPAKLANTISVEGSRPFRLDFIMPDYIEHLKHHLKAVLPNAGLESGFANVYNA